MAKSIPLTHNLQPQPTILPPFSTYPHDGPLSLKGLISFNFSRAQLHTLQACLSEVIPFLRVIRECLASAQAVFGQTLNPSVTESRNLGFRLKLPVTLSPNNSNLVILTREVG